MPNIDLMLTHSCNLRCKYCYEKDSNYAKERMSRETIKKILPIIENIKDLNVTFWGGEPTLEYKNIDYVISSLGKKATYFTSSNGYELTKLIPYLKKWQDTVKFEFQVSYDFEPNQSNNRINKKGKSSNEDVLKTLFELQKAKLDFNIKTTISPDYLLNIEQIYFDFQQLRSKLLDIYAGNDISLAITLVNDVRIPLFTETILNKFKQQLTNILADAVNKNHNFMWFYPEKSLCTAGSNNICVDCDGKVYVCHSAIFTPSAKEHILGNIFTTPIKTLLKQKPWTYKIPKECKTCPACLCFRCNIYNFEKSKKKTYNTRMYDFACDKNYCQIMKIISEFTYAYQKISGNTRSQ